MIRNAGLGDGKTKEEFTLVAPERTGTYQIRLRPAKIIFNSPAFDAWQDADGNEPDATTTIGLIIVK